MEGVKLSGAASSEPFVLTTTFLELVANPKAHGDQARNDQAERDSGHGGAGTHGRARELSCLRVDSAPMC